MEYFDGVKKNFGFGCMRLPMKGEKVDYEEFSRMIDYYLAEGFNYFDTAHVYIGGQSETALRDCLVKRYPREKFVFTNKLSTHCFNSEAEIRPLFEEQLKACGLEYFDFYLMHALNKEIFGKFKRCRAYETGLKLKEEGKIKHFGISFHDKAEVLDEILTEYPQPRSRTEFSEESGDSRLHNFFDLHRAAQKIRIRVCRFSEKIFFVGQYGEKGGVYARKHARKSERFVSAEIHVHADSRIAARFHVLFHFG